MTILDFLTLSMWFNISNKLKLPIEDSKRIIMQIEYKIALKTFKASEYSANVMDAFHYYQQSKKILDCD